VPGRPAARAAAARSVAPAALVTPADRAVGPAAAARTPLRSLRAAASGRMRHRRAVRTSRHPAPTSRGKSNMTRRASHRARKASVSTRHLASHRHRVNRRRVSRQVAGMSRRSTSAAQRRQLRRRTHLLRRNLSWFGLPRHRITVGETSKSEWRAGTSVLALPRHIPPPLGRIKRVAGNVVESRNRLARQAAPLGSASFLPKVSQQTLRGGFDEVEDFFEAVGAAVVRVRDVANYRVGRKFQKQT
jgi:hypothetical protein